MSKIYLYNYNNYFNRIVKKEASLNDYGQAIYSLANTNFNYNDGVETYHDVNYAKEEGDYLIVTETENNVETIVSRWFVIENKRLRGGQHRLQLRRDLIVDNYDKVINAPIILQKGMVKKENNLIFNKEGFNVNQIKTSQTFLTDTKNDFPWLYLYCAKNAGDIQASVQTSFTTNPDIDITTDISNSIYSNGNHIAHAQNIKILVDIDFYVDSTHLVMRRYEFNNNYSSIDSFTNPNGIIDLRVISTEEDIKNSFDNTLKSNYSTYKNSFIGQEPSSYLTEQEANDLSNSNGKLLRDINGNYYRLTTNVNYSTEIENLSDTNSLAIAIYNQVKINYPNAILNGTAIKVQYLQTTFTITATPQTNLDYNVSISQSNHQKTLDSECNIIAIPYADIYINYTGGGVQDFSVTRDDQLAMARALAQAGTTQKVYDMQLLPYGPFSDYCNEGSMSINSMNDELYQIQTYNGTAKNILFYVEYANFTIDIEKTISVPTHSQTNDENINFKLVNECDLWRLCSQNFNGVFEFNVAKNRGVSSFNIDITLRPYNPYLHINPEFNALYGEDWNDARGLICGGDFSLPITGDAFTQYELNNKNYQIAFDRQIQNLEFTQGQEKTLAIIEALTGTLTAGAGGVAGGLMSGGGPAGAIAGGIIGSGASLVGGLADIGMMSARQQEQKSYAIDNYNFRLGNIKALPYSLNKINPLTFNNQVFPIIEYYTCTDEEKEAFVNKIIYSGMTLNVIGTISNFKTNYGSNNKYFYKGTLIRLSDLNLCSHEAFEIYKEIEEGVYI